MRREESENKIDGKEKCRDQISWCLLLHQLNAIRFHYFVRVKSFEDFAGKAISRTKLKIS